MVGNDGLSDGGTDGIDLGRHTATLYADADVKVGELLLSEDKDRLEGLESEGLGLNELNGLAIDLDEATALLGKSASSGRLFPEVKEEKDTRKHQELDKNRYHTELGNRADSLSTLATSSSSTNAHAAAHTGLGTVTEDMGT